jgi:hypothetical protein
MTVFYFIMKGKVFIISVIIHLFISSLRRILESNCFFSGSIEHLKHFLVYPALNYNVELNKERIDMSNEFFFRDFLSASELLR